MLLIGLDDTDVIDSRGTGQLARMITNDLAENFEIIGSIRHQLFFDKRIPYTAKNSSASLLVNASTDLAGAVFERVRAIMQREFVVGSDPGLAIATDVHKDIIQFGQRAKTDILMQDEAHALAKYHCVRLVGLGGSNDGIIGALASVGLAASGNDGRYIRVGKVRDLKGLHPVETVLNSGITDIVTLNGESIHSGLVICDKLRPSRRDYQPVLFVEPVENGRWRPLKLD